MGRHIAKIVCLIVAGFAGWKVLIGLAELFKGWVPPVFGVSTMIVVTLILYFPLARPLADMIVDHLHNLKPQGRHVRAGTGLDEIPVFSASRPPAAPTSSRPAPASAKMAIPKVLSTVPCNLCGGPGGPICPDCEAQMR